MLLGRLHGHDTQKYIQTCPENCLVDLGKVEMGGGGGARLPQTHQDHIAI